MYSLLFLVTAVACFAVFIGVTGWLVRRQRRIWSRLFALVWMGVTALICASLVRTENGAIGGFEGFGLILLALSFFGQFGDVILKGRSPIGGEWLVDRIARWNGKAGRPEPAKAKTQSPYLGDGLLTDDGDLFKLVETAFAITLSEEQRTSCWTLRDVEEAVAAQTPGWNDRIGGSASACLFEPIRTALAARFGNGVDRETALASLPVPARKLFNSVRDNTGLKLPLLASASSGTVITGISTVGFFIGIAGFVMERWFVMGIGALLALVALVPRSASFRYPETMATVGDLVARCVPLNTPTLSAAGARLPDRWSVLVALAAFHGGVEPESITPDHFVSHDAMEKAPQKPKI